MPPKLAPAAVGFSSHSGWAAAVCLGGWLSSPIVVERERILLTSAPLPCEPYHDAKRGKPEEAENIIAAAAEEARKLAAEAITRLAASAEARGYKLVAGGVALGGGRPGMTLSQALSTHAAMHGAEGWLFREALMEASDQCGLRAIGIGERDLLDRAGDALGTSQDGASAMVQGLGRSVGSPWGKDQKTAAMAAIVALDSSSD